MSDDASDQTLPDLATIEADLTAVGRALTRLDEGRYGVCSVCGTEMEAADLDRFPLLETCADHRDDASHPPATDAVEATPQMARESVVDEAGRSGSAPGSSAGT